MSWLGRGVEIQEYVKAVDTDLSRLNVTCRLTRFPEAIVRQRKTQINYICVVLLGDEAITLDRNPKSEACE